MSDLSSKAEELFAEFLARRQAGEKESFDALVSNHPSVERELRRLYERDLEVEAVLPSVLGSASGFLVPGSVVGDFSLVSLIGQGGMGQVWAAKQLSLGGRRVALKFVKPDRVTARGLEAFQREARAGGRLHHPGIIAVHAYGETEGLAWIAMELVEGAHTLRDLIDERASGDQLATDHDRDTARLVIQVADAMQAVHDAGVIHRDLKPRNILIGPDGRPRVSDLGLARITDETALSETGEFAGTYFYTSPEQVSARSGGVDHRADVFSLGVVLYEMLGLQRPFQGDTSHQVASQILEKDPPDLHSLRSRIPPELVVITDKALEKNPDHRYASMAELAADLRHFLAGEPILARPPSAARRVWKWCVRHPTRSVAGLLVTFAFLTISGLSMRLANKTVEANTNAGLAADAAAAERRRTEDLLRLSALQDLEDLLTEADELWPPHPPNIQQYESWLERAEGLVDDLPLHRAKREELRTEALPRGSEPAQDWRFAEEHAEARWWHAQLTKLIEGLEALRDADTGLLSQDAVSSEYGWSVARRLAFARRMEAGFVPRGEFAARWEEALPAIRAAYPGLDLKPQVGLLPIGPDPRSGLWEFAHLMTGMPAERLADGTLALNEETGVVLVLLPGGRTWMGAQGSDRDGQNYDPQARELEGPVHEVVLSAFFLSKHEFTQGQWERLTGRNPSQNGPHNWSPGNLATCQTASLVHPVERVSWTDCTARLPWAGLGLPSEAQWEYGARGGTHTPWWTGTEKETLSGAANVLDSYAQAAGGQTWQNYEMWLDDGAFVHAPAGTYAGNAFGLHETAGNLWEWCLDGFEESFYGRSPEKDPICPWEGAANRVIRGGGFGFAAAYARSARRDFSTTSDADFDLGFRPARAIDP